MRSKILRIIQASMLLAGVCTLSACFEREYYGRSGYGYGSGLAYYPETYSYQEYRPAYRYNDGGGWRAHERAEEREEHEEHEEHEHLGRHDRD